jgi:hypothetical protein
VYGPNLTVEILLIPNFIKILAQVINIFSKIWQNKKKKIYAEIVQVL